METPVLKRKRRTKQEIAAAASSVCALETASSVCALKATATSVIVGVEETTPILNLPSKVHSSKKKKSTQPTVAVVTTNGIQGSFDTILKVAPLIAHLDIRSADVVFYDQPIQYNPDTTELLKEPQPYDAQNENMFACSAEAILETLPQPSVLDPSMKQSQQHEQSHEQVQSTVDVSTVVHKDYSSQELLVCFASSKITQTLPDKVDVFCFWCSHSFENRPCIIPQACENNVWKVYGNFCCPGCALSYLLHQVLDTHLRWERIGLLNRLYSPAIGGRIYPAPARETLAIFGGSLRIEDYREIIDKRQIRIDVHWPPMVSILASMDTKPIDFYETSIKNTFVGGAVFAKTEEGLKLKRSKPLKDRESTLDSCLNLSIRGSAKN